MQMKVLYKESGTRSSLLYFQWLDIFSDLEIINLAYHFIHGFIAKFSHDFSEVPVQ